MFHTAVDTMLVLALLIHTVYGRESQLDPVFRKVTSCSEAGYFMKRELGENFTGDYCYLCFCEDDSEAVCWKDQNLRCDVRSSMHDRRVRLRRSPGFADKFFQDAARDIFQKQTPEECKPFQSSQSFGCPPVDWCIGCTVCDCNANGRWDCHVLSFCPGDKGKKSGKKKRTVTNTMKMKPSLRDATTKLKSTTKRMVPTKPPPKRTTSNKQPANKQMYESTSKMKLTTKPPIKNKPIQKMQGNVATKPTTKKSIPKTKITVPIKATTTKIIHIKPAPKRSMAKKPAIKKTIESKPVVKIPTKIPMKNTTVNKLNRIRQINEKTHNATNIKTNQMMRINTLHNEALKEANKSSKKAVKSSKPVQKKTITTNVKPALRSFQKVTIKPLVSNVNKSLITSNATIVMKNVSSKVMKSSEKIVNEKQKKLSKRKNITAVMELKKKILKNNFKTKLQKNSTIIEMYKKIKEKVIIDRKYGITSKRLNREKRYTFTNKY